MRAKQMLASPAFGGVMEPRPGRVQETLRITVAALLVTVVMPTFRMPFLFAGPYLTFILSQRDTLLTRVVAVEAVLMAAIASILVYGIAFFAWNIAWLRVSLLAVVFFVGFFLMRATATPRLLLGPLVIFSLFAHAFDIVPFPNVLLDQVGWIWAIFGLLFVATFLTQWLFRAPTALELFRSQMRRALAAAELTCLRMAFGRVHTETAISAEERSDATVRLKLLGANKVLRQDEAARCAALLHGAMVVMQIAARASDQLPEAEERSSLLAVAMWIRRLRLRVLRGEEVRLDDPPHLTLADSGQRSALESLSRAGSALLAPDSAPPGGRQKRSFLASDWSTNPTYASFALRATLATMGCYVLVTLSSRKGFDLGIFLFSPSARYRSGYFPCGPTSRQSPCSGHPRCGKKKVKLFVSKEKQGEEKPLHLPVKGRLTATALDVSIWNQHAGSVETWPETGEGFLGPTR